MLTEQAVQIIRDVQAALAASPKLSHQEADLDEEWNTLCWDVIGEHFPATREMEGSEALAHVAGLLPPAHEAATQVDAPIAECRGCATGTDDVQPSLCDACAAEDRPLPKIEARLKELGLWDDAMEALPART